MSSSKDSRDATDLPLVGSVQPVEGGNAAKTQAEPNAMSPGDHAATGVAGDTRGGSADGGTGADDPLAGRRVLLNRYKVRGEIGRGSMGVVYEAYDQVRQEDVAIKVMQPVLTGDRMSRDRFMREARLVTGLSHSGIVKVYDVQQDGELVFLTMQRLQGQTVAELMASRKEPMPAGEVKKILLELCDALGHAHGKIVHGDISPRNVWLSKDGSVKLMDFGVASLRRSNAAAGSAPTDTTYAAPESLRKRRPADVRADQHSLAAVACFMLTCAPPTNRADAALKRLPSSTPRAMRQALRKAMSSDPNDRFEDIQSFAEALQRRMPTFSGGAIAAVIVLLVVVGAAGSSPWWWQPARNQITEWNRDPAAEAELARVRAVLQQAWEDWAGVAQRFPQSMQPTPPQGVLQLQEQAKQHVAGYQLGSAITAYEEAADLLDDSKKDLEKLLKDVQKQAEATLPKNPAEKPSLVEAAKTGGARELEKLLAAGASLPERGEDGQQSIHEAAKRGDIEMLAVLYRAGSDINVLDNRGNTPLHMAAHAGHTMMVEALLHLGADHNVRNKVERLTALHVAVKRGHLDAVKALIAGGADLELLDKHGWTPLHHAAEREDSKFAFALIEAGADPHRAVQGTKETPLLLAAKSNAPQTVKVLLQKSASIRAADAKKRTALHYAAETGGPELIAMLLVNGADPAARDRDGKTPRDIAVAWRRPDDVLSMLNN